MDLVKEYNSKYKGKQFSIYGLVYVFGDFVDGGYNIVLIYSDEDKNRYAEYDMDLVFKFIKEGLWDTTTFLRKKKLDNLLNGVDK